MSSRSSGGSLSGYCTSPGLIHTQPSQFGQIQAPLPPPRSTHLPVAVCCALICTEDVRTTRLRVRMIPRPSITSTCLMLTIVHLLWSVSFIFFPWAYCCQHLSIDRLCFLLILFALASSRIFMGLRARVSPFVTSLSDTGTGPPPVEGKRGPPMTQSPPGQRWMLLSLAATAWLTAEQSPLSCTNPTGTGSPSSNSQSPVWHAFCPNLARTSSLPDWCRQVRASTGNLPASENFREIPFHGTNHP